MVTVQQKGAEAERGSWLTRGKQFAGCWGNMCNFAAKVTPDFSLLVEMSLEVLIGVVDEQLLQAVGVELLEPVDVQHADKPPHIAAITPCHVMSWHTAGHDNGMKRGDVTPSVKITSDPQMARKNVSQANRETSTLRRENLQTAYISLPKLAAARSTSPTGRHQNLTCRQD